MTQKKLTDKTKKFNLLDRMIIGVAMLIDDVLKSKTFQNLLSNHKSLLQYIEFAFIGALGTAVNGFIYFFSRGFIPDGIAWIFGILGSFTFNFILDKYLVFDK